MRCKQICVRFLCFVVLCCLTVLAGCGNDPEAMQLAPQNGNVDADEISTSSADVFAAMPEAAVYPLTEAAETLTLMATDTALAETAQLFDACEEATGVRIETVPTTEEEYYYNYNALIEAGDLADYLYAPPDALTNPDWVNALIPLDDLIAQYAPNYLAAANRCYDGVSALYDPECGIMEMYSFFEEPQLTPTVGIGIRQDWLEELGFDTPETYDDYYAFLQAVKAQYNPELPFRMLVSGISGYDLFNAGFGVSIGNSTRWAGFYQEDGVVKYGPMEDGYVEYVTTMHQWRTEELITAKYLDYADITTNSYLTELSLGSSAVFFVPAASWNTLQALCDFPITAGMDPVAASGAVTHLSTSAETSIYGPAFAVSIDCENPELAVQTADWFYSDEAAGITDDADSEAVSSQETDAAESAELQQENASQTFLPLSSLSGIVSQERVEASEADYSEVLSVWSQQKDTDHMLPEAMYLTDEESEDFSMDMINIGSFADGKTAQFISGDASLSEMDDFRAKLEEYGIQDAIDLLQTALDRWNNA